MPVAVPLLYNLFFLPLSPVLISTASYAIPFVCKYAKNKQTNKPRNPAKETSCIAAISRVQHSTALSLRTYNALEKQLLALCSVFPNVVVFLLPSASHHIVELAMLLVEGTLKRKMWPASSCFSQTWEETLGVFGGGGKAGSS